MSRIKALMLSTSLLLGAAASPALAHDEVPHSYAPKLGAAEARLERYLERLNAEEDLRLERQLAALSADEQRRLEEHLWRRGVRGFEAQRERAWLAEKQRVRLVSARARLDTKQRERDGRAWAELQLKERPLAAHAGVRAFDPRDAAWLSRPEQREHDSGGYRSF